MVFFDRFRYSSAMRFLRLLLFVSSVAGINTSCGVALDPHISAALPAQMYPGQTVDLTGQQFDGALRAVHLGAVEAPVIFWEATRVRFRVPTSVVGLSYAVVTIDGRRSKPFPIEIVAAP
jgi:hypothetical protein